MLNLKHCNICPRECGINRKKQFGFCKTSNKIKLSKVDLVNFEEPSISFKNGSGAIFFSGCNLKCVYCQNYNISHESFGKEISIIKLAHIMKDLQNKHADNINLITGSHFIPQIAKALKKAKLKIPVIFNSGGYENVKALKMLEGLVDIYLPDFKYGIDEIALKYSNCNNYIPTCLNAIKEMQRQTKNIKFSHSGKLLRGVVIRHMVLPNNLENSLKVIEILKNNFKEDEIMISLLAQYTPLYKASEFSELNRKITQAEYNKVLKKVKECNFEGYSQELTSAGCDCIPNFDLSGF